MIEKFYLNDEMSAIIEYEQVNHLGLSNPLGNYIYVRNAFIKPKYRSLKYLRFLIRKCADKVNAPFVYFKRKKYNNKLSKTYHINSLTKEK